MSNSAPIPDSQGDFSAFKPESDAVCRKKCEKPDVRCRVWESSCGGYEDYNYRCFGCGHRWWVDGSDS